MAPHRESILQWEPTLPPPEAGTALGQQDPVIDPNHRRWWPELPCPPLSHILLRQTWKSSQYFGDILWEVNLLPSLCWPHCNMSFFCFFATVSLPLDFTGSDEAHLSCLGPLEPGALVPLWPSDIPTPESIYNLTTMVLLEFQNKSATHISVWLLPVASLYMETVMKAVCWLLH